MSALQGTLLDLLDEFEIRVMRKWPFHRHTLTNQKQADTQRRQNVWPGWLELNSDWSENGTILSAREIQSEYWKLKQFFLFMCIASFLQTNTWLDAEGALPEGAEVTVLPEGSSDVAPHKDAFIATIAVGHVDVGGNVLYQLRKDGVLLSEMIPRHRLRHRA